jgi:hypothetical protein
MKGGRKRYAHRYDRQGGQQEGKKQKQNVIKAGTLASLSPDIPDTTSGAEICRN